MPHTVSAANNVEGKLIHTQHVTPLLRELHWLKVRREFSSGYAFSHIAALTVRRHHTSLRPSTWLTTWVHVGVFGVLQRRRWLYRPHDAPRWVMEPSRWLLLERAMLFRRLFVLRHRCRSSAATWRRHCSSHRTLHHSDQLCDRL